MKKIKLSLVSLFLIFLSGNIFAQDIETTLKLAFPDLYGKYKIQETSVYDVSQKATYRDLYKKLEDGLKEIYLYENNGATEENVFIFALKDLKSFDKSGKLPELKNAIIDQELNISKYMFGKETYGADSVKCVKQLSLFTEYIKQNNMADAYNAWTVLFNEFPLASKNIYIKGSDILTPKIEAADAAGNAEEKEKWIDTLLLMYDQRIQFYGEEAKNGKGYILGKKGVDILKYRTNTDYALAYKTLMESIELQKEASEITVLLTAMKASYACIVKKEMECSSAVDNYILISDILAKQLKDANDAGNTAVAANVQKAVEGVDQFFIKTGCATCEKLEEAFTPRYDANPNDIVLMKKILEIFAGQKCETSALYEKVAEALYALEPSEISAVSIAVVKFKNAKYEDALSYYDKAIQFCTIDSVKATYNYKAGSIALMQNKYSKAISYAKAAISLNANYGEPYILLGTAYSGVAGSCGDAFEQSTVNWVIVDKLLIAKSKDPSLTDKVNEKIGTYSSRYPDKSEAFFRGIYDGSSYNVSCLGETTTVRF